jgi:hypothetical protein
MCALEAVTLIFFESHVREMNNQVCRLREVSWE